MSILNFIGKGNRFSREFDYTSAYVKDNGSMILIDCNQQNYNYLECSGMLDNVDKIHFIPVSPSIEKLSGLMDLIEYCNKYGIEINIYSNNIHFRSNIDYLLSVQNVTSDLYNMHVLDRCVLEEMGLMFILIESHNGSQEIVVTKDMKEIEAYTGLVSCRPVVFDGIIDNISRIYTGVQEKEYTKKGTYSIEDLFEEDIDRDKIYVTHLRDWDSEWYILNRGFGQIPMKER